jgi:hypothetical protein
VPLLFQVAIKYQRLSPSQHAASGFSGDIHSTCPSIRKRIIVIPNFIEVFYVMRSQNPIQSPVSYSPNSESALGFLPRRCLLSQPPKHQDDGPDCRGARRSDRAAEARGEEDRGEIEAESPSPHRPNDINLKWHSLSNVLGLLRATNCRCFVYL